MAADELCGGIPEADAAGAPSARFTLCGREWNVLRGDMETLWNEMDSFTDPDDERLPYWAELWPSSLALAEWLTDNGGLIAGKRCLDLGCGLGFTAMAGAAAGALVTGGDYEERAIDLARRNAVVNGFAENGYPVFRHLDWREPAMPPHAFSFVWAADILYERKAAREVLDFLDVALPDDGIAWIAEPGRTIFNAFSDLIASSPFAMRTVRSVRTKSLSPNIPAATVNIRELRRH
ncbi:MAG: methyltransferase domain-containing protein [Mailhella sp.]|nr:methyltransferase domain-containing protein [Mailhella sp.]